MHLCDGIELKLCDVTEPEETRFEDGFLSRCCAIGARANATRRLMSGDASTPRKTRRLGEIR